MGVMEIIVSAVDNASSVLQGVGDAGEEAGEKAKVSFGAVALATAGAGAAVEGFARSQQDTNATLNRLEIATGQSAGALRDSAGAMTDHTFATSDAIAGMEQLVQMGHDTREEFEAILPHADDLSDATGKDLPAALESSRRVLTPLGKDLNDLGEETDHLTRLITQTDVPLGTLERNLGRVPDELQSLEFGLQDAAAGVEVFRDRGFSAQESVREFRRAVAESEGDMDAFLDAIGMTADEWEEYQKAVEPVPGLTEDLAAANNDVATPLQNLQARVENLMTEYGGLADAAGMLAPVMMALAPAMKAVTAAKWLMNTALLASPITWIIIAVIALVAGFVLLWKHSETFRDIVTGALDAVWAAMKWLWDWISDNFPKLLDILTWPYRTATSFILDNWDKVLGFFRSIPGRIGSALSTVASVITAPFRAGFNLVSGGIEGLVNGAANALNSLPSISIPSWVPGIGGNTFSLPNVPTISLPRLHSGGTFRSGNASGEGLALLRDHEVVDTPEERNEVLEILRQLLADRDRPLEATATIDIGDGIYKRIKLFFRKQNKGLVRRVAAGTGSV